MALIANVLDAQTKCITFKYSELKKLMGFENSHISSFSDGLRSHRQYLQQEQESSSDFPGCSDCLCLIPYPTDQHIFTISILALLLIKS